jgi:DNA-binding transcriptional MerR regulator
MIPMWMSELSNRSGVSVATIKYYLREGLLPPGESTGATRARYDERHVERLRLIRALVDVAGMSHDRVRRVLAAVDDEGTSLDAAIGSAHTELSPEPATEPSDEAVKRVATLIRRQRWKVESDGRHARALAAALDAMQAAGQPLRDDTLAVYVKAVGDIAWADLATMQGLSREGATAHAVIGTLLTEPVLVSLRRMAQENLARRRTSRPRSLR